jgi:type II secretory pathway pseudopilin PulG
MRPGSRSLARQRGFTYFGIIIGVLLIGIALAVVGTVTRTEVQREREVELLFIGHQYRAAIAHYANSNGGGHLPLNLTDLLVDERSVVPTHHLRRLYADPMTGSTDWVLLRAADGGIYGIYSASKAVPRKRTGFLPMDLGFEDAACYRSWRFIWLPRRNLIPPAPDLLECSAN